MAKKSIEDIVEEKLPTFANMIKDIKTKDELTKTLIVYIRQKEEIMVKIAKDEELIKLRAKQAELAKPYNQTINALKNMINCVYRFGYKFEDKLKEEFESNLVMYARYLSQVKRQKNEDKELTAVAESVKEIMGDYNPTIKTLEQKCEYINYILKTKFDLEEPKVEI